MHKFLSLLTLAALFLGNALGAFEIVLPEKAMPSEEYAALEVEEMLAQRLDKLTVDGKEITKIHVGRTPEALKRFPALKDEEWKVFSDGDTLFLIGGGPRGTYYAAAHFLEDDLDIHVWNLFEQYIPPKEANVSLPKRNAGGIPAFWQRNVYHETMLPRDGGRFAIYNRLNVMGSHEITSAYGGSRIIGSPFLCHTFDAYFPAAEFEKSHPEYYALLGGKRVAGGGGELCLSNPEVTEIAWKKMQQYILADEAAAAKKGVEPPCWYDFSYNDNGSVCECEKCKKIIKEEGSNAGLLHRVLRELALRLAKFRPNYYLTTLAYWSNEVPPKKVKIPKNVIVRLCNTSQNQVTPITAPGSAVFRKKITSWGKLAKLGFWEYGITCYDTYYESKPPYPNEFNMGVQYRFYKQHNAVSAFCELQSPEYSDMHDLKAFLLAKLFENPDQDEEALRMLFLTRFYGPAAKYVDEYRRTLRDSAKAHNSQCFTYNIYPCNFTYLDLATLTKSDKLIAEGMKAAGNDQVLLRRLRRVRLNLDNAILTFYNQIYKEHVRKGGKAENFPFDWQTIRERYRAERVEAIKFNFSHNKDYVDGLIGIMDKRLAMMDRIPRAMKVPQEKTDPRWVEIPCNLTGFFRNELVEDPESPIGLASWTNTEAKPGYYNLPLNCGCYDNAAMKNVFSLGMPAAKVPGPGYHWYRTPKFKANPTCFVYVLTDWTYQVPLGPAAASARNLNQEYYCYFSIKFVGKDFPHGTEGKGGKPGIYIDRAFLVPVGVPFTLGKAIAVDGPVQSGSAHAVF